jgi:ABC-2 type transport system ATP-binding protein
MNDKGQISPVTRVELVNLTKTYRTGARKKVLAVDNLNIELEGGRIVGLLGPNGAGKTTLIKMMCGLVLPSRGQVLVNEQSLPARPQQAFRTIGAVLEGNRNIYWRLTVEENLQYFGALRRLSGKDLRRRIDQVLEFINLKEERRVLGKDLSRGMQQRVGIGLALLHDPQILLLDEPMLGLDVYSSQLIRGKLRELASQGRLILLSTHQMRDAQEVCDSVVIMSKGRIAAHGLVRDLLDFFSTSLYSIEVRNALNADQVERLQAISPYVVVKDNVIHLLAERPVVLYQAIEVLRETLAPIVSVAEETNLESIFVALTQAEKGFLKHTGPGGETRGPDLATPEKAAPSRLDSVVCDEVSTLFPHR